MSRDNTPVKHRSNFQEAALSYVEIGASESSDLMRFPPNSATPFEDEVHLGSGEERFLTASTTLMTLSALRHAGFTVEQQRQSNPPKYASIDDKSTEPRKYPTTVEDHFGPDGSQYVAAGSMFSLKSSHGRSRQINVVRVVNRAREVGVVLGTADKAGACGEARITVQYRDDNTVWATLRGFVHAPESVVPLRSKALVKSAIHNATSILQALKPGASGNEGK